MKKQLLFVILLFCNIASITAQDFITTWKTDNPGTTNSTSITIPTFPGLTYNYDVDWDNDGNYNLADLNKTGDVTHDFGTPGTYTIAIRPSLTNGAFPSIHFNNSGDKEKLLSVDQWGTIAWTTMEAAFSGCANLSVLASDNPNLSGVTSLEKMFALTTSFNNDISSWNISNITNIKQMFNNATSFNQDIGGWNTSFITNMESVFDGASSFNQDIGGWDTSSVTNMFKVFFFATAFDQDISGWNMENVTNFSSILSGVVLSVSNYDALLISMDAQNLMPNLTFNSNSKYCNGATARANLIASDGWTITDTGEDCSALTYFKTTWKTDNPGSSNNTSITIPTNSSLTYNYDIDWESDGTFDDIGVTGDITHDYGTAGTYTVSIRGLFPAIRFGNTGDKNKIVSLDQWGNNPWQTMNYAFVGTGNLVGNAMDIPNLSSVSDMTLMFAVSSFNQDIGNWNTSNITNMEGLFQNNTVFNQDIGSWDLTMVTNLRDMFKDASSFNQDIGLWNTQNVGSMYGMFDGASAFNQDIGNWNTGSLINTIVMFRNASSFDQNLSNWDVESLANANNMFLGVTLSSANYDALLIGWDSQNLQSNVTFSGGNSEYCSTAAQNARANMIGSDGWSISDGGACATLLSYFITTWDTNNPGTSNSSSITIPTFSGETYNYDVDWESDGIFDDFGVTSSTFHNYGVAGTYTVTIRGTFPGINMLGSLDKEKIISIDQWGTNPWTSMEGAFAGTINLAGNATDIPNLDNVNNMSEMFSFSSFNQSISDWDVSNVTNMQGMFRNSYGFNQDISNWDTSSVTNMSQMFSSSSFNQNISGWDVSNVTNMQEMFRFNTSFNQGINSWNTSSVTNMNSMFEQAASFNQDLSNWNTLLVTDMEKMFRSATAFNNNIGNWDTSSVTNMSFMFQNAIAFNNDIGNWNTSLVTNMNGMFNNAPSFNQNISWDTSLVTDMSGMFQGATAFNQDISNWNTLNVTNMLSMFNSASSFNQDIGNWNTSNVINTRLMFNNAIAFNQDIGGWNVESLINAAQMFSGVTLTSTNYDALLIGWDAQNLNPNLTFDGGNSEYCSTAAQTARNNMINNDGWSIIDGGACAALSVDDFELTTISLYPNPTKSEVHIKGLSQSAGVTIFNMLGKEVFKVMDYLDTAIDTNGLTSGLYLVKVKNETGSKTLKLVIK